MKENVWLKLIGLAFAYTLWLPASGACAVGEMPLPVPVVKEGQYETELPEVVISEDAEGRWLVPAEVLRRYGIYEADKKAGTYWLRLPPPVTGKTAPHEGKGAALKLPGDGEGNIDIRHIRHSLGLKYIAAADKNVLMPPERQGDGEARQLVRQTEAAQAKSDPADKKQAKKKNEKNTAESARRLGLVLFWDPKMKLDADLPALNTAQPVMSPCAFCLTRQGIVLRSRELDRLAAFYKEKGYAMWPLIDNDFDPDLTHDVLYDAALQEQMIRELIGYAVLYDFKGYNIDFENVRYGDKDALTAFVRKISEACRAYGLVVSMDVTPISGLRPVRTDEPRCRPCRLVSLGAEISRRHRCRRPAGKNHIGYALVHAHLVRIGRRKRTAAAYRRLARSERRRRYKTAPPLPFVRQDAYDERQRTHLAAVWRSRPLGRRPAVVLSRASLAGGDR